MKVEVSKGKASWSLSAFIAVFALLLTTGGSVFWAFSQTLANSDHKVILQHQQSTDDSVMRLEDITVANTGAIADERTIRSDEVSTIQAGMAALKAQNAEIIALLKGEYTR
jgi:hypothetical protein